MFGGEQVVREDGGIEQISGVHLEGVGQVKKDLQDENHCVFMVKDIGFSIGTLFFSIQVLA